ncbi:thioredoxin domain-containing protein [Methylocapsa sp. S129]|uniref:thioredoxin domain-containing protein n=1 Tax=Methylocapsa sp. S129 TaxID=1641869 RepID=UPI001FEE2186|nr:thioredoxin domain-containing protein [Methylocapsa sp. S129]
MLPAANLLGEATSPYLLQHAGNPVHWRAWGPAALAEARALDRPILISIGYAACHWCHVMAHESFENEETAALMNRLFVNVKVDREERPDIDHIYMSALHTLGEQGGWPLTMFLSPDGAPMFGGTYWPPAPRWGRPSFAQILHAVDKAWREKREALIAQGATLFDHLAAIAQTKRGGDLTPDDLTRVAHLLMRQLDPVNGGVGGAPKFPNAPIFRFFWSEHFRRRDPQAREAVRRLLNALCEGGIYDHLGGGFARYSTDAEWHVPHFEKMLYDNAQILELLALAHAETPTPLYAERARETFDWLIREMRVEGAAFAASQDADQDGEEGLFFVWTADEIDATLGAGSAAFKAAYDVRPEGNWEGRNVLRRRIAHGNDAEEAALAAARARLFALRESRPKPGRDDKVLADWNGLMIAALARAAAAFDAPEFLSAARAAYAFINRTLRDERGRLVHAWRDGRIGAAGMLDDHASIARAALALFEATGEPTYLDDAILLTRAAQDLFGDVDGSFFITAHDASDVPGARPRHPHDGATPSGIGLMAEVLVRLFHLTGEERWRLAAENLIRAFTGAVEMLPQSPLLLAAADFLERGIVIVVAAEADDPAAMALAKLALSSPDPATCVLRTRDGADWPADSPGHGKTTVNGAASAYVCKGQTCGLPVTTTRELQSLIGEGMAYPHD